MPWIDDVYTGETIYSMQYGNAIRDRTVHWFTGKPERDAVAAGKYRDGMVCWTDTEKILWLRRGGAWWPLAMPNRSVPVRLWYIGTGMADTWHPFNPNDIRISLVERRVEWVHWQLWAAGPIGTTNVCVAAALPYPPADGGAAPMSMGAGYVLDGPLVRGGGAYLAGIIGAPSYWVLSIHDMRTGGQAVCAGSNPGISVDVTFRTGQADDTPL